MAISQAEVPPATRLSWGNVHQNPWAHGPYPWKSFGASLSLHTKKASFFCSILYIHVYTKYKPMYGSKNGLVGYPQIPKFMNLSSFPYKHDNLALAIP